MHFGINIFLHAGGFTGGTYGLVRKLSSMWDPSKVISVADHARPVSPNFNRLEFMSFRHGVADDRRNLDANPDQFPLTAGRCNIVWGDGHVAAKGFYELYQQPFGGDRCYHYTSAGAERGKGPSFNALTYGYTARQGRNGYGL